MAFQVPIRRGQDHPGSKLSNQERRHCRQLWRQDERTISDLAREHGISRQRMHQIVHQPLDFPEDSA
jgi:transposase-like protein